MVKKITFLAKIITLILIGFNFTYAADLEVVPLKKPILKKEIKEEKISKNIIKPKQKPVKKKVILEKIEEKKITKSKIDGVIVPKSKPLIVKKEINKTKEKSKYFRQRDFQLAKKAIKEMEKGRWSNALSASKKARDKSIYNFIQWRHLLTEGNKATFHDYQLFIRTNKNYPRINRLKYLAEHKLSTNRIPPKRIMNWFGEKEPLSGYGKMILGESLIST